MHHIKNAIGQTPFFETENGLLYNADCLDIIKQMPDECVDLVVTDPPYNVKKDYGKYQDNLTLAEYRLFVGKFIARAKKLSAGNLIVVLGSKILKMWWDAVPGAKLIIVRMGAISHNTHNNLTLQYHSVLTTTKSNRKESDLWENIRWPGEGYFFHEERYRHPAITPERLMAKCIRLFTKEGKIIIDPFNGVGTACVVAERLNRKWIGIEINEEYCKIAQKRIEGEIEKKRQGEIFEPQGRQGKKQEEMEI